MDLFDQANIINDISFHLEQFKKSDNNYNFRCPYCGDSKRSKLKARGGLFVGKDRNYVYHCFNCGVTKSFYSFLEDHFPEHKKKYLFEKYRNSNKRHSNETSKEIKKKKFYHVNLPRVSDLDNNHLSKQYLRNRKLRCFDKFYYAESFRDFVNSICEYEKIAGNYDCPRIIIPFLDRYNKLFGFQGRRIDNISSSKYITIILDESKTRVYGMDSIDLKKDIFIVEGPFDSLFLDNSLAMCGSDFNIDEIGFIKNPIFVYDNEPYNLQICKRMKTVIDRGYRIVIWPNRIKQKDINDMVLDGINVNVLLNMNIFQGLKAKHIFSNWRKV